LSEDRQRKRCYSRFPGDAGSSRNRGACSGRVTACLVVIVTVLLAAGHCLAAGDGLSKGQVVYVPVYSQVQFGDRRVPFHLAVTLVVRNTDLLHPIELLSAAYHDSTGQKLHEYVETPTSVGPLASLDFFLKESDVRGGPSPTFIVRWRSTDRVTPPMVEAIMIGTARQQGISFVSTGRVLSETSD